MADTKENFDKAIDFVFDELKRLGSLDRLPRALRVVALVVTAQGIIDNGGLQYFVEADFPDQPPYSDFVDGYRAIGADAEAAALEQAVALFPFAEPHKFVDRRNAVLDSFKDEEGDPVNSPFEALTRKLCGNKHVWHRLGEFVSANGGAFHLETPS